MNALILFMMAVAADQQLQQLKSQLETLRKKQVEVAWAQGRERTCAIPLLNALKGPMPANPMPLKVPEGQFHIGHVVPPAPSCDDGKK